MTHNQARRLWLACMQGEVVGADEDGHIYKTTRAHDMANLIVHTPSYIDQYNVRSVADFLKEWLAGIEKGTK